MTSTTFSLLDLPPEMLHFIFDRCDCLTVFHSIRHVSKLFYQVVNNYRPSALHFMDKEVYNFNIILCSYRIESTISLSISDGNWKKGQIAKFISFVGSQRFNSLRSLKLHNVSCSELEHFSNCIIPETLISLSIEFRYVTEDDRLTAISSILSRLNLRKLCIKDIWRMAERISWPDNCSLEELRIDSCTYAEFFKFLERLPHLKSFIVDQCHKPRDDHQIFSPGMFHSQISLTSLTINEVRLEDEYLTSLLVIIPSIRHLKLIIEKPMLNFIFDGSYWENFISNNLLNLVNFEFEFLCKLSPTETVPELDVLLSSFRTNFWLNFKRWFVICEFKIDTNRLRLFTSSLKSSYGSDVFVLSSKDNIYNYIRRIYHHEVRYMIGILKKEDDIIYISLS